MWNPFRKNPLRSLEKEYAKLMEEAHRLSQIDRKAGDEKLAQAEEVAKKIESLVEQGS